MLSFEEMPEDDAELASVEVSLERLVPDDSSLCPRTIEEVLDYLRIECPDGEALSANDLSFIRTAVIEETKYWVWHFKQADESACYLTVSENAESSCIGYEEDYYGLSPEQYILGDYHGVF